MCEICRCEICTCEICMREICMCEICTCEICTCEICTCCHMRDAYGRKRARMKHAHAHGCISPPTTDGALVRPRWQHLFGPAYIHAQAHMQCIHACMCACMHAYIHMRRSSSSTVARSCRASARGRTTQTKPSSTYQRVRSSSLRARRWSSRCAAVQTAAEGKRRQISPSTLAARRPSSRRPKRSELPAEAEQSVPRAMVWSEAALRRTPSRVQCGGATPVPREEAVARPVLVSKAWVRGLPRRRTRARRGGRNPRTFLQVQPARCTCRGGCCGPQCRNAATCVR